MPVKNYGFVIDNRKCIGCHACSTACKSENEVPLGVYRTWVKYVETGVFPNSRRHFQVTRCNHCANPPCVRICPVQAMYQREDGIVEFDSQFCIGCKACLQACPYDAIYIDPDSGTAAKCHYCAHRTDVGLEPACVVVCPEHAIIAGDMNDPGSEISQVLAWQDVTVRKPEQGTAPKLFYIEGNEVVLHPTAVERTPQTFMWADVIPLPSPSASPKTKHTWPQATSHHSNGTPLRAPQPQGYPWNGPIQFGTTVAEQMVQVGYNAQHNIPWHWPVPAYLVTKGIGSGIFLLLSLAALLPGFPMGGQVGLTYSVMGFLALLFLGATTGLLVYDLEHPERFFYILRRPQWKSWLARGAVLLVGLSVIGSIWWLLEVAAYWGWGMDVVGIRPFLAIGTFPFAVGVALYTAFLFAQAEGRDLWQSPLLPFHLVVQALVAGSAVFALADLFFHMHNAFHPLMRYTFMVALVVDLFLILAGEFAIPHASEVAAKAAHEIKNGRYRYYFWWGVILLGHVIPLALVWVWLPMTWLVSAVFVLVGLYLYEYLFVMAPQEIPNS